MRNELLTLAHEMSSARRSFADVNTKPSSVRSLVCLSRAKLKAGMHSIAKRIAPRMTVLVRNHTHIHKQTNTSIHTHTS